MNTPNPLQSVPPQQPSPGYPGSYPGSYPGAYPQGSPQYNRTAAPVKVFGVIYAVLAAFSVFGFFALLALALIPGFASHSYDSGDAVAAAAPKILFGILALVVLLSTVLHAAAAYGLLALKPWGRTMAIVTSIITLISIPIGTIIGGLALYYLMREGAAQEYDRLASAPSQALPTARPTY